MLDEEVFKQKVINYFLKKDVHLSDQDLVEVIDSLSYLGEALYEYCLLKNQKDLVSLYSKCMSWEPYGPQDTLHIRHTT